MVLMICRQMNPTELSDIPLGREPSWCPSPPLDHHEGIAIRRRISHRSESDRWRCAGRVVSDIGSLTLQASSCRVEQEDNCTTEQLLCSGQRRWIVEGTNDC